MKTVLQILLILLIAQTIQAQDSITNPKSKKNKSKKSYIIQNKGLDPCSIPNDTLNPVFIVCEQMPSFPGGDDARIRFLTDNINYPIMARESDISGTVFLCFIVEKDGSLSNVQVMRGIGGGCDEEAIRVVRMMPKWTPGKQRGKPVRVQFNMPIKF